MAGDAWTIDVTPQTRIQEVTHQLSLLMNVPQHLLDLMTDENVLAHDDFANQVQSQILNVFVRTPTSDDLFSSIPIQEDRAVSEQIRFIVENTYDTISN